MAQKNKKVGYVKPEIDQYENGLPTPNDYVLDDEPNTDPGDDPTIPPIGEDDEPNIDPGDDPTGDPLDDGDIVTGLEDGYLVEFDEAIKGLPVKIQCTWANCFTEPVWDRGLCIRSYDHKVLKQNNSSDNVIGITTGNYHVADNDVIWLQATLKYCDRRPTGWFRQSDIWHAKKGITPPVPPTPDKPEEKKKFNWLTWLVTGASILRIIS